MKKLTTTLLILSMLTITPTAFAGDCTKRNKVNKEGTITSAVYLRDDCPTTKGNNIGTIPGGEVVKILEIDQHNEFYLVESSVGTGFIFKTFITDVRDAEPTEYKNSIFWDLPPDHEYYDEIFHVKEEGIVNGNPDGSIEANYPINRVALAKILVEATTDTAIIESAELPADTYSDDTNDTWYSPYLKVARDKGIMTGDKDKNTVRPGDDANVAEVAKMIATAFELDIRDEQENEKWYDRYIEALDEMDALPSTTPKHIVTRGEMMFTISNVLGSQSEEAESE